MSITPWTIYWITRLDEVKAASHFIGGALLGFVVIWAGFTYLVNFEGETPAALACFKKHAWKFVAPILISLTVNFLTPTSKEMCAILVVPALANSQNVERLGTNVVGLAEAWLKELRPAQGGGSEVVEGGAQ